MPLLRVEPTLAARALLDQGFVHVAGPFADPSAAWSCARAVCAEATRDDPLGAGMPPLEVVGRFTVPPAGATRRDFQALHLDFGLPLGPTAPTDVARFTALHVERDRPSTTAATRIVPLPALLGQRTWDAPERVMAALAAYGSPVEGILGRLVEAADGSATLPAAGDGFLCGMEFASVADEREHLAARGLDLAAVERRVHVRPGELLVFDNLATAHGRAGTREPLELHQLCLGYRSLAVRDQRTLTRRVLGALYPHPAGGLPTRSCDRECQVAPGMTQVLGT
jgi:hypothetical protein